MGRFDYPGWAEQPASEQSRKAGGNRVPSARATAYISMVGNFWYYYRCENPTHITGSRAWIILAFVLIISFGQSQTPKTAKTDAEIKRAIINESIASYRSNRGNCPCPYNTDRAGHRCGARSAYSRPEELRRFAMKKMLRRKWSGTIGGAIHEVAETFDKQNRWLSSSYTSQSMAAQIRVRLRYVSILAGVRDDY